MKAEIGDKVRVKGGCHSGERGFVEAFDGEKLAVRLEELALTLRLRDDQVTNFSLAARKAWVTGPHRSVGRRKGTKLRDRVTVTFRIDRNLWEEFMRLMEDGRIVDRNSVVNDWFREKLASLNNGGQQS